MIKDATSVQGQACSLVHGLARTNVWTLMEDRYTPDECVSLLEEAQCGDEAAAAVALRRVALNAASPHPAVSAAALQVAVIHPAAAIPHLPDIISASPRDVDSAIATFADLLQADRSLLVPIIGALADMPLSVTHRAQARATLSFALDTVDEDDLPTVVRTVIRTASTPALARWAAPALRTSLARVRNPDVVLVVGMTLIQACRAHPFVTRALLDLHSSRKFSEGGFQAVPQLTWLDVVVWAVALEFRTITAHASDTVAGESHNARNRICSSSSTYPANPMLGGTKSSEFPRSDVFSSIQSFLKRSRGFAVFPEAALDAVRAAGPVLARLREGTRRLVTMILCSFPASVDVRPVVGVVCRLVADLPAIAADVVHDVSLAAKKNTQMISEHDCMRISLPNEILAALTQFVRPSLLKIRNGSRLPPQVSIGAAKKVAGFQFAFRFSRKHNDTQSVHTATPLQNSSRESTLVKSSSPFPRYSAIDIHDDDFASVFITVRKGIVFGAVQEVVHSLRLAEEVVKCAPASVATEMIALLDKSLPVNLSEPTATHMLGIVCQCALRMDQALDSNSAEKLYHKRVRSLVPDDLLSMEKTHCTDCTRREDVFCRCKECDILVINVDTAAVQDEDPTAVSAVVLAGVALLTHAMADDTGVSTDRFNEPAILESWIIRLRSRLSVNILLPETCLLLHGKMQHRLGSTSQLDEKCELDEAAEEDQDRDVDDFKTESANAPETDELIMALRSLAIGIAVLVRILNYASQCVDEEFLTHIYSLSSCTVGTQHYSVNDHDKVRHVLVLLSDRLSELMRMYRAYEQGLAILLNRRDISNLRETFLSPNGRSYDAVMGLIAVAHEMHKSFNGIPSSAEVNSKLPNFIANSVTEKREFDIREQFPTISVEALLLLLIATSDQKLWSEIYSTKVVSSRSPEISEHVAFDLALLATLLSRIYNFSADGQKSEINSRALEHSRLQAKQAPLKGSAGIDGSCVVKPGRTCSLSTNADLESSADSLSQSYRSPRKRPRSGDRTGEGITCTSATIIHRGQYRDEFFGDDVFEDEKLFVQSDIPVVGRTSKVRGSKALCRESTAISRTELASQKKECEWACGFVSDALCSIQDQDVLKSPVVAAALLDRAGLHASSAARFRKQMDDRGAPHKLVGDCVVAASYAMRSAVTVMQLQFDFPWCGPSSIFAAGDSGKFTEERTFGRQGDASSEYVHEIEALMQSFQQVKYIIFANLPIPAVDDFMVGGKNYCKGRTLIEFLKHAFEISVDESLSAIIGDAMLVVAEVGLISEGEVRETILNNISRVHEYHGYELWKDRPRVTVLRNTVANWINIRRESGLQSQRSQACSSEDRLRLVLGGRSGCPWYIQRYRLVALFGGMFVSDAVGEARLWVNDLTLMLGKISASENVVKQRPEKHSIQSGKEMPSDCNNLLDRLGLEPVLEILTDIGVSSLCDAGIPSSMGTRRAYRKGSSPIMTVCNQMKLLHELIRLLRSYQGGKIRDCHLSEHVDSVSDFEIKSCAKLAQGLAAAQRLVTQLSAWYSNCDTQVSKLSEECIRSVHVTTAFSCSVASDGLAFASDMKSRWSYGSRRTGSNSGSQQSGQTGQNKRHSRRANPRPGTNHSNDKKLLRYRRLLPRLIFHADKLDAVSHELCRDLGLKRQDIDALLEGERQNLLYLEVDSVIRRWHERCEIESATSLSCAADEVYEVDRDSECDSLVEASVNTGSQSDDDPYAATVPSSSAVMRQSHDNGKDCCDETSLLQDVEESENNHNAPDTVTVFFRKTGDEGRAGYGLAESEL